MIRPPFGTAWRQAHQPPKINAINHKTKEVSHCVNCCHHLLTQTVFPIFPIQVDNLPSGLRQLTGLIVLSLNSLQGICHQQHPKSEILIELWKISNLPTPQTMKKRNRSNHITVSPPFTDLRVTSCRSQSVYLYRSLSAVSWCNHANPSLWRRFGSIQQVCWWCQAGLKAPCTCLKKR